MSIPSTQWRQYCKGITVQRSSLSWTIYIFCVFESFFEKYATGWRIERSECKYGCRRAASRNPFDTSLSMTIGNRQLKDLTVGKVVMASLIFLWAFVAAYVS